LILALHFSTSAFAADPPPIASSPESSGASGYQPVNSEETGMYSKTSERVGNKKIFYAEILRSKDLSQRIPGLAWSTARIVVETEGSALNTQVFIRPIGRMSDQHAGLLYKGLKVRFNTAGHFRFKIPIWGELSQFSMKSVTPEGQVVEEKIVIRFRGWKEFKQDFVTKNLNFNISAGFSYYTFSSVLTSATSPAISDLNVNMTQFGISTKISAFYLLIPGVLDIGVNAFITVLPLLPSKTDCTDDSSGTEVAATCGFRNFGTNFRLGYVIPFIDRPWRLSLMLGYYYLTMLNANSYAGYTNLHGPQLFPLLLHYLPSGQVLQIYFKFSPVAKSFGFDNLNNREIAAGIGWVKPVNGGKNIITVNFDFAQVDAIYPAQPLPGAPGETFDLEIHGRSFTLSLGFGF